MGSVSSNARTAAISAKEKSAGATAEGLKVTIGFRGLGFSGLGFRDYYDTNHKNET